MKSWKKLLIAAFVLCCAVCVLTVSVSAADTVNSVEVLIETPVLGQTPDTRGKMAEEGVSSEIASVEWIGELDRNGCFKEGVVYTVRVVTQIKSSLDRIYKGVARSYVKVNGNSLYNTAQFGYLDNNKKLEFYYQFPYVFNADGSKTTFRLQTSVRSEVDEPVVGQRPDDKAASLDGTRVDQTRWIGELDQNGCFKAGVAYTVEIELHIKETENWVFCTRLWPSDFTVNNKQAHGVELLPDPLSRRVRVSYTFPAKEDPAYLESKIAQIETFGIKADYGQTPAPTIALDENLCKEYDKYTLQVKYDQATPKLYSWFTSTVTYKAKDGYIFTNDTKIEQPGKVSGFEVVSRSSDTIVLKYYTYTSGQYKGEVTDSMKDYVEQHKFVNHKLYEAVGTKFCPGNSVPVVFYEYPVKSYRTRGEAPSNSDKVYIIEKDLKELIPEIEGEWYLAKCGTVSGFVPACFVKGIEEKSFFEGAPGNLKKSRFSFAGGSGTMEDPYLVANAEQLNAVRRAPHKHYRLIADIDLSNWGNWVPIGGTPAYGGDGGSVNTAHYGSMPFIGSFDGNGHVISGMTIRINEKTPFMTEQGNVRYYGLFARVGTAPKAHTIRDLGVINYTIDICYTDVQKRLDLYVAGIAPLNAGMDIINCYSAGGSIKLSVTGNGQRTQSTNTYVGGICAEGGGSFGGVGSSRKGSEFLHLERCFNTSDITVDYKNTDGWVYAGGIMGGIDTTHIYECWNSGNITIPMGTEAHSSFYIVGGIVARAAIAEIPGVRHHPPEGTSYLANCYNTGALSGCTAMGIFNYSASDIHLYNCYNVGKLTGNPAVDRAGMQSTAQIVNPVAAIAKFGNEFVKNCYGKGTGVSGSEWQKSAKLGRMVLKSNPEDTFTIPAVKAKPSFVGKFEDVRTDSWYAVPVQWAVDKKITAGTSDTTFSPDATCTRAQIIMFLWRAVGSPGPTADNPFTDVKTTDYYHDAARWAYSKGMVTGTQFKGDTPCTRADTVTYLWKNVGAPKTNTTNKFSDVAASADYAQAVGWALENSVTAGTSDTTFSPAATCTRAQIVTFLRNALK